MPELDAEDPKAFPQLLSVAQVMALLGLSRATVYMLIKKHGLPTVLLSRRCRRIPREALLAWLKARTA